MNSRFQLLPALTPPIETCQIHPLKCRAFAYRYGLLEFALGRFVVLLRFSNSPPQFMSTRSIDLIQLLRNRHGFVDTAAHDSWRIVVKLAEVGQRLSITRIQSHRGLELPAHALCQ